MRRGEVWRYQPVVTRPGQATLRLIVSAEAINASALPVVLAVHIMDTDPGGLLAVPIGEYGWASALTIEPVVRARLVEHLGDAEPDAMDHLKAALRAAQDL
jgi:mRNA-degrading endonuclease toxin of MazEF toxin-antitoxin module